MTKTKRTIGLLLAWLLAFACLAFLAGCTAHEKQNPDNSPASSSIEASQPLSVAAMKGPTAIGLSALLQQQQTLADGGSAVFYDFTVAASADEIVGRMASDPYDIMCLPANLAARLYDQTDGAIRVIGINTLGVLYGISHDSEVHDISDLAGRTVYLTGKGTVPGYTVEYLLARQGVSQSVALEYASEPSEALARMSANLGSVAIVPEPFATTALAKDSQLSRVLDLTALWDQSAAGNESSGRFITGVTAVRSALIDEHPEQVATFIADWNDSVQAALSDPSSIGQTLTDLGILGSAALADQAVPRCNIVCITGEEMHSNLSGYLSALYEAVPASIGGSLPDEAFYYIGS